MIAILQIHHCGAYAGARGLATFFAGGNIQIKNCSTDDKTRIKGGAATGIVECQSEEKSSIIEIKDCTNRATLVGESEGIAGICAISGDAELATITNCVNYGDLDSTCTEDYNLNLAGVAISSVKSKVAVINCKNQGDILLNICDQVYSAGIIEICDFIDSLEVSECINTGSIILKDGGECRWARIGGVVSWNDYQASGIWSINISDCVNSGNINIHNCTDSASGIAGIAFLYPRGSIGACQLELNILNCVNNGAITVEFKEEYSESSGKIAGIVIEDLESDGAFSLKDAGDTVRLEGCTNNGKLSGNPEILAGVFIR